MLNQSVGRLYKKSTLSGFVFMRIPVMRFVLWRLYRRNRI